MSVMVGLTICRPWSHPTAAERSWSRSPGGVVRTARISEPEACGSQSVGGGLVEDDGEADDLPVSDEVAGHDQLVG